MKLSKKISIITFTVLFATVFMVSSSCKRNKDCDLIITIQDATTNGPIVGATVELYPGNPPSQGGYTLQDQEQSETTDASGVARFTFKLPALLAIKVTPPAPYTGNTPPYPLVKLEEGRSVSKSVKLY